MPSGNALVSDGEAMKRLTMAGMGISRLTRSHVDPEIAAGQLVPLLENYNPGDREAIHAVFVGHGGQLPARVRAFLDYLVETVKL
jgi:DNA-binding transcriptional LysR family regulator